MEWSTERPTEIDYYFVFGAEGSTGVFVRWIVPGQNDDKDTHYMPVELPEPPLTDSQKSV